MIDVVRAQSQQRRRQVVDLTVAVAQPLPGDSLFPKLVEWSHAEVSQIGRVENGKFGRTELVVGDAAGAVYKRAKHLQSNVRRRHVAVSPVRRRQNDIPK